MGGSNLVFNACDHKSKFRKKNFAFLPRPGRSYIRRGNVVLRFSLAGIIKVKIEVIWDYHALVLRFRSIKSFCSESLFVRSRLLEIVLIMFSW